MSPPDRPRILAIDSKKYRGRGVWTMVGEVAPLRLVGIVQGVPGPRLAEFLGQLDRRRDRGPIIGVVTDGNDALRSCVAAAFAHRPGEVLLAANAFHLVKGVNEVVLAEARTIRRLYRATGGVASTYLSGRSRLLLPRIERLTEEKQAIVATMRAAAPSLAVVHDYAQRFQQLLERRPSRDHCSAATAELLAWANSPPPGYAGATKACRDEVRGRLGEVHALFVLRARTACSISTGQVEALQMRLAHHLIAAGGRASVRQAMATQMARSGWSADELATAADSLAAQSSGGPR